MDNFKAKQLEQILTGKKFLNYKIDKLINCGKSAAVFKATDEFDNTIALKVFDNDLIERFGHEIQEKRIEQEIDLKGHSIPNLVKIIDGGKTQIGSSEYYYIIMELISGKNLKEYINNDEYDNIFIQKVVNTIYKVTEDLLLKGIVHRDIKPENIMINDFGEIILMDLGVLKLIGVSSFSDQEEKQFVGTLRYAPPEFLTREEEDSEIGWRAVNLYQIGALLHDLIMKEELFAQIVPYSNLVISIKEDAPRITNTNLPFETVQLARDLLSKDWRARLKNSPKERIEAYYSKNYNDKSNIEKELEDIFNLTSENKVKFENIEKIQRSNIEKEQIRKGISTQIELVLDECIADLLTKRVFDKTQKSANFSFVNDKTQQSKQVIKNFLYSLQGDISNGYPRPMFFLVRICNDENSLANISFLAMFLSQSIKIDMINPLNMFKQIIKLQNHGNRVLRPQQLAEIKQFTTYNAFTGTVGFDGQFKQTLMLDIVKLIKVALQGVAAEVSEELELREQYAKNNSKGTFRKSFKTKFFSTV